MTQPATAPVANARAALWVLLAGVSVALHVGKLPPAIPLLRDQLGVSLVQAGFLLSLVQLAGMALGLAAGLLADGWGLRRTLLSGLCLLGCASAAGAFATSAEALMVLRAFEGAGLLMAVMPAPGLIRRNVPPQRIAVMLGWWGTYMPMGSSLALLAGPTVIALAGWAAWWVLLAACTLAMAGVVWRQVPADPATQPVGSAQMASASSAPAVASAASARAWVERLRVTLSSRGPWLAALSFAVYSGQWLAVIGFLPSILAQGEFSVAASGLLSAAAAAVNMLGNAMSGRLLTAGWTAMRCLWGGFAAMALGSVLAFAPLGQDAGLRYAGVLLFSSVGGLIPGTLFALSVRLAPSEQTVSTTVGLMQQLSALGQFLGPPLVATVASMAGGWHQTWVLTGACSIAGAVLAWMMARTLRAVPASVARRP